MQPHGRSLTRRIVRAFLVFATAVATPITAGAQTPSKPPSSRPAEPRWEVSFSAGVVNKGVTPNGTSRTPNAGPAFVMADGATPSRFVSSWFYGDGTALLNQVLSLRGIGSVHPLERPDWPVPGRSGVQVGGRIARHLKGGVWFEAAVDVDLSGYSFDGATQDRIDTARAHFETAFSALAASAASVITSSTVTSAANLDSGGRRFLMSGVIQYRGAERVVRPVLLAGLGVATTVGSPATLTVTGTYRFTTPAQAVIEETDTMRLRYETPSSLVWILGGGIMHDLSRSSAYRVELRLLANATKTSAFLEATPSRVTASPGGVVVLNATSPGIQFSSAPIVPTLSLARTDFEAFNSEGRAFQLALSASYVRKF